IRLGCLSFLVFCMKQFIPKLAAESRLTTPKPKFVEEVPAELDKWLKQLHNQNSFEDRILAVNKLGKFKCNEVIEALSSTMLSDKVDDVRETAYERLKRFGLDIVKPPKAGTYTDPDLSKKLHEVADSLKVGFSYERFESRFKSKFPEDFDLHKYTKKNRFKSWLKKQMTQVKKT
ncbi:HEAT repeat domain-containing protein, partial [Vibrio parahaemolyticus]|nr:HEAT repeat domain-containing protein [Vibrio parahaemolyticus]